MLIILGILAWVGLRALAIIVSILAMLAYVVILIVETIKINKQLEM